MKQKKEYGAVKEIDKNTIHIVLPREQVAPDMLWWSLFLSLFMVLGEIIIYTGNAPRPVMLMPLPLLPLALLFFNQWYKWFSSGQWVAFEEDDLVIRERFLDLIPRKKSIPLQKIEGFAVIPYVVYRSQTTAASSSGITKGFCVKVLFRTEKLFWFIEKDKPHVTIGAYLKRDEAVRLRSWLDARLAKEAQSI